MKNNDTIEIKESLAQIVSLLTEIKDMLKELYDMHRNRTK
mgnify:CR=1 FL=1